jgi:hypothetical protein
MKKSSLIAVGVFLLLLVVVLATREQKVSVGIRRLEPPPVAKDKVTTVEISGNKTAHLVKDGDNWFASDPQKSPARFPTDDTAVKGLLDAIPDFKGEDFVTDKKDRHADLEVDEKNGLRVKLKTGSAVALDVVFGKYATSGGYYVRLPGKDEVYATKSRLATAARKDLAGWRKRTFINAKPEEISSLTVKFTDNDTYTVEQDAEKKVWALKDGTATPAGFRFDAEAAGRLASSLTSIRATEFLDDPAKIPAEMLGLDGPHDVVEAVTRDGRTLTLSFGRENDPEDQTNANTLKTNLEAVTGDKEGKVTREKLQAVLEDASKSEDVKKAARRLLDQPEAFARLDMGIYGATPKDDALSKEDLEAASRTANTIPVRLAGDPQTYLVSSYVPKQIRKRLTDLRDMSLVKVEPDKATRLAITSGDKKAVAEKKDGTWTLVEPKTPPPGFEFDPGQVQSQVNMLKSMRGARLVEPSLPDAQSGIAKPSAVVQVDFQEGPPAVVKFGKDVEGAGGAKEVFVKGTVDGALYAVGEYLKKRYDNPVDIFKKPAPPPNFGGGGMGGMQGLENLPPEVRRQLEAQMKSGQFGR